MFIVCMYYPKKIGVCFLKCSYKVYNGLQGVFSENKDNGGNPNIVDEI